MKRLAILALASALVATSTTAQDATGGAWKLKPEDYVGQLGVYAVDDIGTGAGRFDDYAEYPAGTHFLIRYDMELPASYHTRSNVGLEPSSEVCNRLVAEILRNKSSLMGYRFYRAANPSAWPTTDFPAPLKAHLLRERDLSQSQNVEIAVDGASALCFRSVIQNGDYAGQSEKVEAWVAFKP